MPYLWELKGVSNKRIKSKLKQIFVYDTPQEALDQAHAVAVLTEWDEFKTYDWESIYKKKCTNLLLFLTVAISWI
jgi:UDPglucose 6-dehydrogenase